MKQKIHVSFDIEIDYPTIPNNKRVEKCTKQWAKEWIMGTEWSDFVPIFYDGEDDVDSHPLTANFEVKAKHNNKIFMNKKWKENETDIGLNSNGPIILLKVK